MIHFLKISALFVSLCLGSSLHSQDYIKREDYKQIFARLDSFLVEFVVSAQLREPSDDTLSLSMVKRYQNLFAQGVMHPDLINPVMSSREEPIMPSKAVMKSLDDYIHETSLNYSKGVFMNIRAINASFDSIINGEVEVVLERKLWGEWRKRWRMEMVDTVVLHINELHTRGSISSFDVIGFGYVLTDFKSIQEQTLRISRVPDLAQIRRKWERENLKVGLLRRFEVKNERTELPDSVVDNSPCCVFSHVVTGSLEKWSEHPKNARYSLFPEPEIIVYSDRLGTNTYVKPDAQSEAFRDLSFLQPFYVVDTCGEFLHIIEYKYGATVRSNGRIKSCLQDFGWVKKSKMLIGGECMYEQGTEAHLVLAGTNRTLIHKGASAETTTRRYYQNPSLSDERENAPPEKVRLFVYKKNGTSVLLGVKQSFDAFEVSQVIIGWIRITDLLKGLNDE